MPITKQTSADNVELSVSGRIDGAMANELEIAVLEATGTRVPAVYINLANATFLCSAGLRVLLQYWRQMTTAGRKFLVINPSPEVDAVLSMTGFRPQLVDGAPMPER